MADPHRVTCLALCAGSGALELGLRLAVPHLVAVCFAEWDSYAAAVVLARMEDQTLEPAPVWCGDLRDLDSTPFLGVDLVTAGFPCPPFSSAGKRAGTDDARWLWPDIARVVRETRPRYVFLENVPGLLVPPPGQLAGLGHVLRDLAALGFSAEWLCLGADDVGASHIRKRVFVLAYRDIGGRSIERSGGVLDRLGPAQRSDADGPCSQDVADAESPGQQGQRLPGPTPQPRPLFAPAPDDHGAWAELLAVAPGLEPSLCRDADGLSPGMVECLTDRLDRLRLLGNGVVPLSVAFALQVLCDRAGITL